MLYSYRAMNYEKVALWKQGEASVLENPMDSGAWWATVHGVANSQTRLNDFTSLSYKAPVSGSPSHHPKYSTFSWAIVVKNELRVCIKQEQPELTQISFHFAIHYLCKQISVRRKPKLSHNYHESHNHRNTIHEVHVNIYNQST